MNGYLKNIKYPLHDFASQIIVGVSRSSFRSGEGADLIYRQCFTSAPPDTQAPQCVSFGPCDLSVFLPRESNCTSFSVHQTEAGAVKSKHNYHRTFDSLRADGCLHGYMLFMFYK